MSSTALIAVPIELTSNPLPYGRMSLRAVIWDQLQARKAYDGKDPPSQPQPALDKRV